ncbi:MAG: Arc family DNA-binding protein [Candidatus Sedimenticola sp. (ex Thyasira tokunagai)]
MKDARQIPPMRVRLPEDLKAYIKKKAEKNMRSINSEVVMRLEESRKRDQANEQQK